MRICAFVDCQKEFDPRTHNQRFHSDECCRVATNRRIMERYYEKKARKSGGERTCKTCTTKLSRYNESEYCTVCEQKNAGVDKEFLLGLMGLDEQPIGFGKN